MDKQDWKEYVTCRLSELEPKVMGTVEPSLDDALLYFKFHEIFHNVFGFGEDLSKHVRNPYNKNPQNSLDTNTKINNNQNMENEKVIKFLQKEISELHPLVFGQVEPSMTHRMTYFAYSALLLRKFSLGVDMKDHPRNPWKDQNGAPLDFDSYGQIKKLPEHLAKLISKENLKSKTQIIATVPAEEIPQKQFRVFDVDYPHRTVYQGTEAACHKWWAQANKDCGYKAFDFVETQTKNFVPRDTNKATNFSVRKYEPTCGCHTNSNPIGFSKPATKFRVADYLKQCKENPNIETTEVK